MLWARQDQSTASRREVTSAADSSAAIASKCCEHSEHLKNCCTYCLHTPSQQHESQGTCPAILHHPARQHIRLDAEDFPSAADRCQAIPSACGHLPPDCTSLKELETLHQIAATQAQSCASSITGCTCLRRADWRMHATHSRVPQACIALPLGRKRPKTSQQNHDAWSVRGHT